MTPPLDDLAIERLLVAAFDDARATVVEHPDLFARVATSIEQAAARRRFRLRLAAALATFLAAITLVGLALSDFQDGRIVMPWWVVELITNIVLVAIAVALGPFIKRFGRAYAADVFRENPGTGKSYLVLTDVAYYLIFTAFVLFTVRFEESDSWVASRGELYQHELARIGGILLIMGVLHTANVVALPVIGNLLRGARPGVEPDRLDLGAGTYVLKIERAPERPDT
jgi:hypothetical protein